MTHAAPQTPGSGFRSTFAVRHTWPRFKGGRGYKVRSAEFSIKWILSLTISNVRRSQKKEQINTGLPVVFNTDLQIIPNREKLLPPSLDPTSVSVTPPPCWNPSRILSSLLWELSLQNHTHSSQFRSSLKKNADFAPGAIHLEELSPFVHREKGSSVLCVMY